MAIREILEVPDSRLKTVSAPVDVFDDGLKSLVADMFETMYAANGIGLAAIQVGVPSRVLVIDLQPEDFNTYQQGSLAVPDIYADVDRPAHCRVRWQDLDGNVHEEAMEGLLATCIQHEMDHLEGVLFIDHLSRLKRTMALKKLEKLRKAA